jgi:hypothetical protein
VFTLVNQYQQEGKQTTFTPWVPPTKPNFADLDPLKPTNLVAGYALPAPQATVRYEVGSDNQPVNAAHFLGAYYETLLAYQVQAGGTFGNAQIVVWWGAVIGSNGSADVISVDPTTGQVTLWDSKARTDTGGGALQSKTFTNERRRETARRQAVAVISALPTTQLSADLQQKALASLDVRNGGNYLQQTVRYRDGINVPGITTPTPTR